MNMPVRPLLLLAVLLGGLLLLFGCITPPQADRCKGFASATDHDGCLRYYAVWDQEPYLCYSIANTDQRASCLEASNDPVEQQKLKDAQANGIAPSNPTPAPTAPSQSMGNRSNATLPSYPAGSTNALIAQCMANTAGTHDSCASQVAIDTLNMTLCSSIDSGDFRAHCISIVAITTKKSSQCGILNRTADKQICTYYSSG